MVDAIVHTLSFSSDGRYLETNRGLLDLDPSRDLTDHEARLPGIIFVKNEWVCRDGHEVLWLPRDYRGPCLAFRDNLLVIGRVFDQVAFMEFSASY
jgi:hypothetical protein